MVFGDYKAALQTNAVLPTGKTEWDWELVRNFWNSHL